MESLSALDRALFLLINKEWASSWADSFFPAITDLHKSPWFALPFCAGLLALLIYRYQVKNGSILFGAFAIVFCFLFLSCARLINPLFERFRPPQAGLDLVLRCPEYGGASFPSTHASNMFCACVFLAIFFPKARWFLIAAA